MLTKNREQTFLNMLSVESLSGIGPKNLQRLEKLSIHTVLDLLLHLPFRYQDKTRLTPIQDLQAQAEALIQGEISSVKRLRGKKPMLLVGISDKTGQTRCRFFHYSSSQMQALQSATRIRCFGEVRQSGNQLELVHPEYRLLSDTEEQPLDTSLTPIYSVVEGLGQITIRKIIKQALALLRRHPLENLMPILPPFAKNWPEINDAVLYCHEPPPDADTKALCDGIHPAQQRLSFEELAAHQLCLKKIVKAQQSQSAIACYPASRSTRLQKNLPFELTSAQHRVIKEILNDMQKAQPMYRLLQGDVGSGKTIIATIALIAAIDSGCQAALMAPTEILAEQHYEHMQSLLTPLFNIQIGYLGGKQSQKEKQSTLAALKSGDISLLIGTHALFQEQVLFHNLGLIVIDEQHRFGVHQRLSLKTKNQAHDVHQLVMTATPIPRTLAMTAFAALDTSIIDELPPGRTPIKTVAIANDKREEVIQRIQSALDTGKQVYWVCTLIDESDALQMQAAESLYATLQQYMQTSSIGLVHGRLKPTDKQKVMEAFSQGTLQCLVATTVIEVGVNIPNASIMVIENAERLGLSQLHQLRGRVGRSAQQSHCILLYQGPLSDTATKRLQVMRQSTDGFFIAEQDLLIRGSGEVFGTRQSGLPQYQIAQIIRDKDLIPPAQAAANALLAKAPEQADKLVARWLQHKINYVQA